MNNSIVSDSQVIMEMIQLIDSDNQIYIECFNNDVGH